jgi:putative aminopeptidase
LVYIANLLKKEQPRSTVYLVGTVWEEYNLRGAIIAARACKPDIAIALDVVLAGDTPDLKNRFEVFLGKGPALMMYNFHGRGTLNGTIPHKGLTDLAMSAAKQLNIPLQRFAAVGILTDSSYVQLEGNGIAALELGFPARYAHTPTEICDIKEK